MSSVSPVVKDTRPASRTRHERPAPGADGIKDTGTARPGIKDTPGILKDTRREQGAGAGRRDAMRELQTDPGGRGARGMK